MKKFLLTIILAVVVVASAWAGPRSLQQAKAIARQQASTLGIALTESNITSARVKGQAASANASYYVFTNNDNNGFVIISGDDQMPDLVGYSTDGTFDENDMPENLQDYLNAYDATVKAVQRGDKAALSIVAEAKALRTSKSTKAVAPLLAKEGINYDQMTPYNLLCPTYKDKEGNENYTITGCAATAMAQILRYYKYPSATLVDIPSYTTTTRGITMPAIPKGTTFDWDNMLGTYRHVDYTDAQAEAVATLMLCCGCSMRMDYDTESGADPTVDNFINFGYAPDLIQMVPRYAFTLADWTNLIDAELAAERPVYYIGYSQTSGHAFVCDGSDKNGLYHINWGWDGRKNSYFDISILNPAKGGSGSGNDTEGYTRDCAMIIGIAPDNGVEDKPLATYPAVTFSYYRPNKGESDVPTNYWNKWRDNASDVFEGQISGSIIYNNTNDLFTGDFGFGIKNPDGSYEILDKTSIPQPGLPAGVALNYRSGGIKRAFPVGKTEILPLYSLDGGKNWDVCSTYGVAPIVLNATDTDLEYDKAMEVTMEFADKDIYVNTPNDATIKIKSNMSQEYNGTLYLYMQDMASDSAKIIGNIYVSVKPGEEVTQTLPVTPKFLGSGDDHEVQIAIIDLGLTKYFVDFYPIHETATPIIKLVGVESNADPEDTTSKAEYINKTDNKTLYFVVPEVKHDKFTITYTLQNSAEKTSALDYYIYAYNPASQSDRQQVSGVARIDGNGATTKLSATIDPFETGNNMLVGLYIYSEKDENYTYVIDTDLPNNKYYATDATQKEVPANFMWVYVTGEADGIESVTTDEGDFVGGGNGMIVIKSSEAKHVNIYNLSGQKVTEASLSAGEQQTITVRPGIYIVGGKKVAVK